MSQHTQERCSEMVWDSWRFNQCQRKGVVEHEGKLYCKQHSPQAVQARRKASVEKRQAEYDAEAEKYKRRGFALAEFEGMDTEAIPGSVARLVEAAKTAVEYFQLSGNIGTGLPIAEDLRAALAPFERKEARE